MPISMNQVSQVTPGVLSTGGSGQSLSGTVLTENTEAPLGTLLSFTSSEEVGDYFGLSSLIYEGSLIYFAGVDGMQQLPGILYVLGYNAAAAGAWLRGAGISGLSLTQLQAISGTLIIEVDGTTNTSSSFSLSAATSFSEAATLIAAAFTSPNFAISYNAQQGEYQVSSNTTGASSTVGFATGTAAAALGLAASNGGVQSVGQVAMTPASIMAQLLTLNRNWGGFTGDWEATNSDAEAYAAWTSAQNSSYFYAGYSSDADLLTTGSTETWLSAVITAGSAGTIPSYGGNASAPNAAFFEAMFVLSWAASLNWAQTNGRTELDFRSAKVGLVPSVTSDAAYQALLANGCNSYGQFASNSDEDAWYFTGQVTGPFAWASSYVNQILLNSNMQSTIVALMRSLPNFPYNAVGYGYIEEALAGGVGADGGPIQQGLNFGAIKTGVQLSSTQITALQQVIGVDISQQLMAQGYYLQITPATPSQRLARQSPPVTVWYLDGQSIQQLNIASINVQ